MTHIFCFGVWNAKGHTYLVLMVRESVPHLNRGDVKEKEVEMLRTTDNHAPRSDAPAPSRERKRGIHPSIPLGHKMQNQFEVNVVSLGMRSLGASFS